MTLEEEESVDRGWRDSSGVIGPLLEQADVSDNGEDCRRRVTNGDVAVPHAVYSSVQMLEIPLQNRHFRHFSRSSARLADAKACSATRCSIMRSDMIPARRDSAEPF
jgi:hypothetical protein